MIRIAIISVTASIVLVGAWTINLAAIIRRTISIRWLR
jgi:hypothetical protein